MTSPLCSCLRVIFPFAVFKRVSAVRSDLVSCMCHVLSCILLSCSSTQLSHLIKQILFRPYSAFEGRTQRCSVPKRYILFLNMLSCLRKQVLYWRNENTLCLQPWCIAVFISGCLQLIILRLTKAGVCLPSFQKFNIKIFKLGCKQHPISMF